MSHSSEGPWAARRCLLVACLLPLFAAFLLSVPARAQELDTTSVPAQGFGRAHLNVKAFGRFSIRTRSGPGVSIQLVDRVAGPGELRGQAGREDGRIDRFLDRGVYRILTAGSPSAEGVAALEARRFRELNGSQPPQLVEHRPVEDALGDIEQRSYWLEVEARRTVVLEAAGRNLSDLRLWKDGTWLVGATPLEDQIEPKVGRPLRVRRLAATLEPGLYLLTAYGGPPLAWAEDDGTHPVYLRFGITKNPSTLRKRFVISPFGYDRFVVSEANTYRVELEEARPLSLEVRRYNAGNPFQGSRLAAARIEKNSVPPVAEAPAARGQHMVTVTGAPGRAYVLQHFTRQRSVSLSAGRYLVSTVHGGAPEDAIDATGILVAAKAPHRALKWQTITVDGARSWRRRFNLLARASVFVDVREAGSYRIQVKGSGQARLRVEPFLTTKPRGYRAPSARSSGVAWSLEAGLHVLTLLPQKPGIVDVTMGRKGASPAEGARRVAVRFPNLRVAKKGQTLYVSEQPGVSTGIIARRLPLDLREPVSLAQGPDEVVSLETRVAEEGLLIAEAEDGTRLELSVDGGPWKTSVRPAMGRHDVRVRHGGPGAIAYALGLQPSRTAAEAPLPPLPEGRQEKLPQLPELSEDTALALDLDRASEVTYLVRAPQPGLYRLESTGLLATQGILRTRVNPRLVAQDQNGVGRNFLVQQYLGVGDYQLTAGTRGRTRGHLGLRLRRTAERDGGRLANRVPARATLAAGEALSYSFRVPEAGRYRLRSLGRNRSFRARLEDAEGWPLERPNGPADFDRRFEAGEYRLIVLPETVEARVVTVLEHRPPPAPRSGHGPHALTLDESVRHVWQGGPASARDTFRFDVPAHIDARIELTGRMQADLFRVEDQKKTQIAYVPALRGWSGALPRGRYQLEARPLHRTTGAPYTLAVRPEQLVVGATREVRAPAVIEMALGALERVEITSFGRADVEARLWDAKGRRVAQGDDRPDDWNFLLAPRLEPGRYRLQVNPVGTARARTEIRVTTRAEQPAPKLSVETGMSIEVGARKRVFPLSVPDDTRFLVAWARSAETIGLALARKTASGGAKLGWRTVAEHVGRPARIELPLNAGGAYRLEVWSVDQRNSPVTLDVHAVTPKRITEAQLARGVDTKPSTPRLPLSVLEIELDRPGTFRFEDELRWSPAPARPLGPQVRGLVHASTRTLWIARPQKEGEGRLVGRRVVLRDGRLPVTLDRAALHVDLDGRGAVLARLAATRAPPGLAVYESKSQLWPGAYDLSGSGEATAVHFGADTLHARLFSTTPITEPLETTLTMRRFETTRARPLAEGGERGSVPAGEAREFTLPKGLYRFRIAMEAEGVAAVGGDRVERVVIADGAVERFDAEARRLLIANPTSTSLAYVLEVTPTKSKRSVPYEAIEVAEGRLELSVPPAPKARWLRIRGAQEALYVAAGGGTETGRNIRVGPEGGVVRVRHGAGPVLAWLDDGHPSDGLFGPRAAPPLRASPGIMTLRGSEAALELEAQAPTLFVVRVGTPVVTQWHAAGGTPEVKVAPGGASLPVFVASGGGQLRLRALGGSALPPSISVAKMPVSKLSEGAGPEVIVGPGQAQAFTFELADERALGLGLRATAAEVTAELRTWHGAVLGRGVAQMHTLAAGQYVLVVASPATGRVARVQPAIVGLEKPPSGPPPEILKSYLSKAGYTEAP